MLDEGARRSAMLAVTHENVIRRLIEDYYVGSRHNVDREGKRLFTKSNLTVTKSLSNSSNNSTNNTDSTNTTEQPIPVNGPDLDESDPNSALEEDPYEDSSLWKNYDPGDFGVFRLSFRHNLRDISAASLESYSNVVPDCVLTKERREAVVTELSEGGGSGNEKKSEEYTRKTLQFFPTRVENAYTRRFLEEPVMMKGDCAK